MTSAHSADAPAASPPSHNTLFGKLRFRQLQIMAALDEASGLRQIARELHMSQPAISKALAEVERTFELPLFERTAKGLVPTPAGQEIIRGARRLLNELLWIDACARRTDALQFQRPLRLGVMPYPASAQVARALADLEAQGIGYAIRLTEASTEDLLLQLTDSELDAVIMPFSAGMAQLRALPHLRTHTLCSEPIHVVGHPEHPLAHAQEVTWPELARQDWVLPMASTFRHYIDDLFQSHGCLPVRPRLETTSQATAVKFAAEGLGLTMAIGDPAAMGLQRGAVVGIPVPIPIMAPPLTVMDRLDSGHAEFIEQLTQALRRLHQA